MTVRVGKNGRLTYSIIERDPGVEDYVGILPSSGIIFLKKQLDREEITSLGMTVRVQDQGVPQMSDTARVKLNIVDVNDNKPVFTAAAYSFSVVENIAADSVIGVVSARDGDTGRNGEISYSIKSDSGNFRIDNPSGEIRTVLALDREEAYLYHLEVEAVDGGVPRLTSTAMLEVRVLDENDNAPEVIQPLQEVITVREKQPPGTPVAQIIATDADKDENATLVYDFKKDGGSDYSLFAINQNDGIITTGTMLEHNSRENYSITVLVSDLGNPPRQSSYSYTVRVLSKDDISLPFSKSNLVFRVAEDASLGTVVGSVRPDTEPSYELGGVWYSVMNQGNEGAVFEIENLSGNIIVTGSLDADIETEYNLKVSLNDDVYGMSRQIIRVKIVVTDVNDNRPQFATNPLQVSVSEDSAPGSPVYTVTARDLDMGGNGTIRYDLKSQFPDKYFRMDSLSGELFLVKKLNYESAPQVFLTVQATDSPQRTRGRQTSDVAVVVTVEDVNDHAPEFISTNNKQIQRSLDIGVPFHRVLAVDSDSGPAGEIEYEIVGGNVDETFQLDENTGLLSVTNRPRKSNYRLNLKASDGGSPSHSSSQILEIKVADVSRGPPKFSRAIYSAEVGENEEAGTLVTSVRAEKRVAPTTWSTLWRSSSPLDFSASTRGPGPSPLSSSWTGSREAATSSLCMSMMPP